ncbi:MAG: PA domain-containing protein, partial [Putridiphycobacter sp.]|nr:PA domain-containing protein [Putridiphycobacter sp.]
MKKLLLSLVASAITLVSFAQVSFYVNPPSSNSGNYSVTWADDAGADWAMPDPTDPANAVEDTLVIVQGVDSLGCDPLTNSADVAGHIALIWRGACEFGTKALNAQNAGAIAVVIVNNSGEPVGMGGGADGINVTIPVVMISTSTGQLLYDEIMGGNDVSVFIGNKFGYFANDIGVGQKDVLRARQFATPIALAANDTEFSVPVGAWVYNFGTNNQTNVTLNAKVSLGATVLYDETSTAVANLASGDSVWIPLPTFSETSYMQDYYTMVYSITSDSPDDFVDDNALNADFMFTNNGYTYASTDPVTSLPKPNQFFQSSAFTSSWGACMHFADPNASRKAALGLTFSATSSTGTSLADEIVAVEAYEWTDPITDLTDPGFSIATINLLAVGEFTYTTDSQEVNIYMPFTEPLVLEDNKDYIFCATSTSQNVFLGYDN